MIVADDAPAPTRTDAPDTHDWFRTRVDEFIARCDATVGAILKLEAAQDLSREFALPSTDDLIGLPPSSRGTDAYATATKNLKDRLMREVHLMESAVERQFRTLATTEKALSKSKREVRDLRSVLAQMPQHDQTTTAQQQLQQQQRSLILGSGPSLSTVSSAVKVAYPADIAVSLAEEQQELKQLRLTMQGLQSQLVATRKDLAREKVAFKDTCDTAVRCNTKEGPQSLRQ
jgi:hypothetical protein